MEWAAALGPQLTAPRRLLDVAMGRGRHALVCAGLGYRVFGVDVNVDAVRAATMEADRLGLRIRPWCADLTAARRCRGSGSRRWWSPATYNAICSGRFATP